MDPEIQEVFNLVVSKGINLFDTADSYGTGKLNGKSELLLGKFIQDYPGSPRFRDNIHIATKFAAYPWRILPANMVAACKGSLQRLGLEQISLGQLHWSASKYAPLQELALWNGLADCYQMGLVKAVGVSNYGAKQLRRVHKDFAKREVPLSSAQVQFSLLSCGTAQMDVKSMCDDLGITLIAYSPLALGLLTGKYSKGNLPQGPRGGLFRDILPGIEPLLSTLEAVAKGRRKTVAQVAINWCICQGTVPIPGAKDLTQAKENLGALGWRLSPAEVEELTRAANACNKKMIQNIFQTA